MIRVAPLAETASGRLDAGGSPPDVVTLSAGARATLLVVTGLGSCVGLAWAIVDPNGQFFLFGMLASLVVTIPIVRPGYAVLGPWSLLAVVVYLSCGVRGLFIALRLDGRLSIDALFLLGHGPGYFARPSALYVVALAIAALGSMWRPRRSAGALVRSLVLFRMPPLVGAAVAVMALIGFAAFVLYAQRTGGLAGGWSTKRTTIDGLELATTYKSHGELRFLNTFSSIALWLQVARRALDRRRTQIGTRACTAGLLLNAALLPVYASSRSEVGYIALVAFVIHFGIVGHLPRFRTAARWAAAGVLVLAVMTVSRLASQGGLGESVGPGEALTDSVGEVLVYNRNFGDMQTTAHIIHAVPQVLPLQHGATITTWLAAPVPRAVWPEKPQLQSGPIIGARIYGNERSGVPPGFVAEMYWNFALPGVLIGSLLLGLTLAVVRETFVPYLRGSPPVALFYGVVVMRLGAYVLAGGVGSGIFKLMADLVCLLAAGLLVSLLSPRREARARRGVQR